MKFYGSLQNRLMEGKNVEEIKVGMDITMYYYSDRHCYYVTDVVNQKEIKVKEYYVCADQDKSGGMGHQDWMYFKTLKEYNIYLNKYFDDKYDENPEDDENPEESEPETWVFRYNKWMRCNTWDLNKWNELVERCKEDSKNPEIMAHYYSSLSDEEVAALKQGKTIKKYSNLSGKISFGIKDYYYDWEF